MRAMIASKALVVGAYQRKLEEIAALPDIDLVAVVPPSWRDPAFEQALERRHAQGYTLVVSPLVFNGSYHLFFFPRLGDLLDTYRPDVLHIDEEPYNTATCLAVAQARRRGIASVFFTWQNLARRYPPPFSWMERYTYRATSWAIAGTEAAAQVLRRKGYHGPLSVIPQFGIDPDRFTPRARASAHRAFTVGFLGRLVPEKGVDLLIDACTRLDPRVRLVIAGDGPARASLEARIRARGLEQRVQMTGPVPSTAVPDLLQRLDVVVLPSRTRPNWAEQFGRVLIEAMAAGVPVVGSTCGEIPAVIGDAGLVFPEGDTDALASALSRLTVDADLWLQLSRRGRARALERFTHRRIALDTVDVYARALDRRAQRTP